MLIETFTNADDGVEARVFQQDGGYVVQCWDIDANEMLPTLYKHKTVEAAREFAKEFTDGEPPLKGSIPTADLDIDRLRDTAQELKRILGRGEPHDSDCHTDHLGCAVLELIKRHEKAEVEQQPPHHDDLMVPISAIEKAIAHVWERREHLVRIFGSRPNRPDLCGDISVAAIGAIIGQFTVELAGHPGFDEDKFDENCTKPTMETTE